MKTTNVDILRSFYSVTNRNELTEEIYQILLKQWNLENVDLNEEMIKINAKHSSLSRSRRNAIPEFIRLREMLDKKKENENNSINMNDSNEDGILIGNDFITNQFQVESNTEIN